MLNFPGSWPPPPGGPRDGPNVFLFCLGAGLFRSDIAGALRRAVAPRRPAVRGSNWKSTGCAREERTEPSRRSLGAGVPGRPLSPAAGPAAFARHADHADDKDNRGAAGAGWRVCSEPMHRSRERAPREPGGRGPGRVVPRCLKPCLCRCRRRTRIRWWTSRTRLNARLSSVASSEGFPHIQHSMRGPVPMNAPGRR